MEVSHLPSQIGLADITAVPIAAPQRVDEILQNIGAFGRYHVLILLLFALLALPQALQGTVMFYAAHTPTWTCRKNSSRCALIDDFSADNLERCDFPRAAWNYTQGTDYSIVTEFGLDCNSAWLAQLPTSIFYLGAALGSIIIGWLCDNFGRRTILLPSIFFIQVLGVISALAPRIEYLVAFRFLIGFGVPGAAMNMSVILSELVVPKYRAFACACLFMLWPFGMGLMSLTAYLMPAWRTLLLITSCPLFVALGLVFFTPESFRWLIAMGRQEEALSLLRNIAHWNKKPFPKNVRLLTPKPASDRSPKFLFSSWKTTSLTLIISAKFFTVALVYYGIPMCSNDITDGSMYVNFTLTSLIELPALLSCAFAMNRIGRKPTIFASLLLTGGCCVFVGVAPSHWSTARLIIGVLGRFMISLAFPGIWTWTSELYPTLIRSQGLGFGNILGMVGSTCMPWLVKSTKQLHPATPFIAMGVLSVLVSCMLLILPETKGKHFSSDQ